MALATAVGSATATTVGAGRNVATAAKVTALLTAAANGDGGDGCLPPRSAAGALAMLDASLREATSRRLDV